MVVGCDGKGFMGKEDASCELEEVRSFAKKEGVLGEGGRKVMLQDGKRVDETVGERVWCEK